MSKRELKALEKRFNERMYNCDQEFYERFLQLESHFAELEKDMIHRHSLVKEKDYEWMRWLIAIAAGVFSVIVTQVSKMSLLSFEQLLLLKVAISANALGVLLGAIYLYTDIRHGKDLIRKIQIQRYYLMLENKRKYDRFVRSDNLWFAELCKPLSLICFLIVVFIWVVFIWQMQVEVTPPIVGQSILNPL